MDIFKVSCIKIVVFSIELNWNLFSGVQLTMSHHWFRWWLGAEQATSHYEWWPSSLSPKGCHYATVYPKKYSHGFVVLCFVVVMQSFIMNSHEVFIHIHQGCFVGTGTIVRLPQCQWSKPDGYGKISQCIATTKHSKAKTVCVFLGLYCNTWRPKQNGCHFPDAMFKCIFFLLNENVWILIKISQKSVPKDPINNIPA